MHEFHLSNHPWAIMLLGVTFGLLIAVLALWRFGALALRRPAAKPVRERPAPDWATERGEAMATGPRPLGMDDVRALVQAELARAPGDPDCEAATRDVHTVAKLMIDHPELGAELLPIAGKLAAKAAGLPVVDATKKNA
jgi:hypothetical protein